LNDEACKAQLLLLAAHKRFPLRAGDCGRPGLEAATAQALDEEEPTCARRPDKLTELRNLRGVTSLRDAAGAPLRVRGPQVPPTKQDFVAMPKVGLHAREVAFIRGFAALVAV
jgi:hypothetical protein